MKTNVLNEMKNKLNELNKEIKFIEDLKIGKVDEETWHKICLTPIRYDYKILKEIAKATFPEGYNFNCCSNEIEFNINGFLVTVPTTGCRGINIKLDWYSHGKNYEYKPNNRFYKMRKYFELLDSGNYTWYDLAKTRRTYDTNKVNLFLWWFLKAKWHKVDRERWENAFNNEDKENEIRLKKYNLKVKDVEDKLKKINETIDILKEFAEVKGYVCINDLWQTTNIENYFR